MAPLSTIERQVEDPAHAHFRSDIAIISDRISGIKKSTKLLAVEVRKLGHTR